jgi:hypothetical protein
MIDPAEKIALELNTSYLQSGIVDSAAFLKAIRALLADPNVTNPEHQASDLANLLVFARLAQQMGDPDPLNSFNIAFGQSRRDDYLAVSKHLRDAARILKRVSPRHVSAVLKLADEVDREATTLSTTPLLPTIDANTGRKRGGAGKNENTSTDPQRAELIRGIDPFISKNTPRRLTLIRDLVFLTGRTCTTQHVQSALEYRNRKP